MSNHLVIFDTQIKPSSDMRMMDWFGQYIIDQKPDVIVHIGDHFDLPSLSTYDRSTKAAEGRRLGDDLQAGKTAMYMMLRHVDAYNERRRTNKQSLYKPRMVFTEGNHEERLQRHVNANPSLDGVIGRKDFQLEQFGFEVYHYLVPVTVDSIQYVHCVKNRNSQYMKTNPKAILQQEMTTTICGHQPGFQMHTDYSSQTNNLVWGIINGASYLDNEDYRVHTGNMHFRGIAMLRNVSNGSFDLELIRLETLGRMYG